MRAQVDCYACFNVTQQNVLPFSSDFDPDYISFNFRTNVDFLYHLNFCSEGFKAQTEKSEFLRFAVVSLESHGKMKIKSHNLKTDTTELLYTKRHLLTVPMRYFRSILVH